MYASEILIYVMLGLSQDSYLSVHENVHHRCCKITDVFTAGHHAGKALKEQKMMDI